jgi:hypothetical protein
MHRANQAVGHLGVGAIARLAFGVVTGERAGGGVEALEPRFGGGFVGEIEDAVGALEVFVRFERRLPDQPDAGADDDQRTWSRAGS